MSFDSLGLVPRVLDISEIDEVFEYEKSKLAEEDFMQEWNAPWRKESLDHYVPKGWCFAVRDSNQKLVAYFLAQPLLFFNGLTQTLWVEHISYNEEKLLPELVDLARRYARDKHLQKVVIRTSANENLTKFGAVRPDTNTFEFVTTKMV